MVFWIRASVSASIEAVASSNKIICGTKIGMVSDEDSCDEGGLAWMYNTNVCPENVIMKENIIQGIISQKRKIDIDIYYTHVDRPWSYGVVP